MPMHPVPPNQRSWFIKLMHGLFGFFSGLLTGPYVALERAFNYFAYQDALILAKAPAYVFIPIALAVPVAILIIPWVLGFTVYAMARGFFVGWQYAVYGIANLHAVLSVPTYVWSGSDAVFYGRAYLNRRFGMYDPTHCSKQFIDFLYSENPVEQQLAKGYFKYLERKGKGYLRYGRDSGHARFDDKGLESLEQYRNYIQAYYKGAYWEKIDSGIFCEYLVENYAGGRSSLRWLRDHGLTLTEIFTNAKATTTTAIEICQYPWKPKNCCAMILDTYAMRGVVIDPGSVEENVAKTLLESFLVGARTFAEVRRFTHCTLATIDLMDKQIDYVLSYMFIGQAPYVVDSYNSIFEQILHQLMHQHGHLFSQETVGEIMGMLIENYLKWLCILPTVTAHARVTIDFSNALIKTIGLFFINDKVDFIYDEEMDTLIGKMKHVNTAGHQCLLHAKQARIQRTVDAITASCPLPVELAVIIAGYKGTFFTPSPVEDDVSAEHVAGFALDF